MTEDNRDINTLNITIHENNKNLLFTVIHRVERYHHGFDHQFGFVIHRPFTEEAFLSTMITHLSNISCSPKVICDKFLQKYDLNYTIDGISETFTWIELSDRKTYKDRDVVFRTNDILTLLEWMDGHDTHWNRTEMFITAIVNDCHDALETLLCCASAVEALEDPGLINFLIDNGKRDAAIRLMKDDRLPSEFLVLLKLQFEL